MSILEAEELSFPELTEYCNIHIEKELNQKKWEAKLCINNAVISMSILSGKKINIDDFFPGLFDDKVIMNQADKIDRDALDKQFILSRIGIDKRGGQNNG